MSWTDSIKAIEVSQLAKVVVSNIKETNPVDAIGFSVPLEVTTSNPERAKYLRMLSAWQGSLLAPKCAEVRQVRGVPMEMHYLIGDITFHLLAPGGGKYKVNLPLLIPQVTYLKPKGGDWIKPSCLGFYWRGGMAIAAGDNPETVKNTIVHEMIHAMVDNCPGLKQEMYGNSDADQREEAVTHICTDLLDKLISIKTMDVKVAQISNSSQRRDVNAAANCVTKSQSDESQNDKQYESCKVFEVTGLSLRGQQLVSDDAFVFDASSSELKQLRQSILKEVKQYVKD